MTSFATPPEPPSAGPLKFDLAALRRSLLRAALLCLFLPGLQALAQPQLTGRWNLEELRWTKGSGPQMEVRLELRHDGSARLQSCELLTGFAEKSNGECVAFTTRVQERTLEGRYSLAPDRLVLRWKGGAASGFVPASGGAETWTYLSSEGRLRLAFPDRDLVLRKEE